MSRRITHVAAVAALTLTAAVAGAQGVKQQGANTAAAQAAISRLWDDVTSAIKRGDATAIAAIYTPNGMIVNSSDPATTGRADVEKSAREWLSTTKIDHATRARAAFEVYGDVAIESGTFAATTQEKGKAPEKYEGRYVMVFKKVDGKWLTYLRVTAPLTAAPAKK